MRPKVVSLFTGAGGLDLGFEAAGFRTAFALDSDKSSCQILKANRRWPVFNTAIESISSAEILTAASMGIGEPDVLIAGPPCQPFSKAGYWSTGDAKRLKDPRANTLREFLRVLEDLQPRAFLLENVKGMAFTGKDEGIRYLENRIRRINAKTGAQYKPAVAVLNAADFGIPQTRERVFVIAARDGQSFLFPTPTHSSDEEKNLAPYLSSWDAIGDLPIPDDTPELKVNGKWGALLPSIPEGHNYLYHTPRGKGEPLFGWRTRYWSFLLKLAKNRPAWTLSAQPGTATGPFHWANRRLSVDEMARLQTFPKDYSFPVTYRESQKALGNAVPSLLAEVLAREVRQQLLGGRRQHRPLKLEVTRAATLPKPMRKRCVPKQYLDCIADHADHPGTGLGPMWTKQRAASGKV